VSERRIFACDGGCGQKVTTMSATATPVVAGWMVLYGAPGGAALHFCSAPCLQRVAQCLADRVPAPLPG
jgi:hypothetical protein